MINLLAMIKTIPLGLKKVTNLGIIKPLPLTGLAKEWSKVKEAKNKGQAYLRIGAYLLGGLVLYGLIWRGLPFDQALELLKVLF